MNPSLYQRAWHYVSTGCRPFIRRSPPPAYGYAWAYYPTLLRRLSSILGAKTDDHFGRSGVKIGTLPPDVAKRLREAIDAAPRVQIQLDDHDEGYVFNPGLGPYEAVLNRDHVYVQLGSNQSAALVDVMRALRRPVAAALGTPWHVVNTRCWRTAAGASESGPNAWHTDGFPLASPKLMVYMTGAGPSLGTTEIKTLDGKKIAIEGPPGTWVLFRNGDLEHRGIGPRTGERIILELTLSPALRFDPGPVFAGLNAKFPRRPWYRSSNRTGQLFSRAKGPTACG
ncbi:MAG TPA: hypothetical protein VNH11_01770 [Pirellulales bacterium]|nr:hypothetical protein [Pirellulales bacterium]